MPDYVIVALTANIPSPLASSCKARFIARCIAGPIAWIIT